jgi:hypothetical protein
MSTGHPRGLDLWAIEMKIKLQLARNSHDLFPSPSMDERAHFNVFKVLVDDVFVAITCPSSRSAMGATCKEKDLKIIILLKILPSRDIYPPRP